MHLQLPLMQPHGVVHVCDDPLLDEEDVVPPDAPELDSPPDDPDDPPGLDPPPLVVPPLFLSSEEHAAVARTRAKTTKTLLRFIR